MAKPRAQTIQARFGFKDNDLKTATHDTIMIWLDKNLAHVINYLRNEYELDIPDYDNITTIWEQPIMSGANNQYCIGFVDMWLPQCRICVEVKSKIDSAGELIRQIRMYEQYVRHVDSFVVVSPDDRFKSALESQGILFYKYTGDPLDTLMI